MKTLPFGSVLQELGFAALGLGVGAVRGLADDFLLLDHLEQAGGSPALPRGQDRGLKVEVGDASGHGAT